MIRIIYIYDNVNADKKKCPSCNTYLDGNSYHLYDSNINQIYHLVCYSKHILPCRKDKEAIKLMMKLHEKQMIADSLMEDNK